LDAEPSGQVYRADDPRLGEPVTLQRPADGAGPAPGYSGGTVVTVASLLIIMMHLRVPDDTSVVPALHALRSSRLLASRIVFLVLDSLPFALGSFFLLLLCRIVLRRTWLAVLLLMVMNVPLSAWSPTPTAVFYAIGVAALFCLVVLRLGLLASVAMLATHRMLTSLPITLKFDAWYVASSASVLLIVLGAAILAFRLTIRRDWSGWLIEVAHRSNRRTESH
jgi:hypothetical protein